MADLDPATALYREEAVDICAPSLALKISALLDRDPAGLEDGRPLPGGWHFGLFPPAARQSELQGDGRAPPPAAFPEPPGSRTMLGGREVELRAPIPIGSKVKRLRALVSLTDKPGRSGPLTLARWRHRLFVDDRPDPAIIEIETMIHRHRAAEGETPAPAVPATPEPHQCEALFEPDPSMLFRYSAIGFNTHRVHYDETYARQAEGYPGLVVNGGLTALMLLELFKSATGREIAAFRTRNLRPLFCGQACRLRGRETEAGWRLWALNPAGEVAVEAVVR